MVVHLLPQHGGPARVLPDEQRRELVSHDGGVSASAESGDSLVRVDEHQRPLPRDSLLGRTPVVFEDDDFDICDLHGHVSGSVSVWQVSMSPSPQPSPSRERGYWMHVPG